MAIRRDTPFVPTCTPAKKVSARADNGIEFNYHSPRWSGEILDCSMPMSFDQYDHCSFNCMYCFSYNQKSLKELNPLFKNETKGYQENKVRAVNPKWIEHLFDTARLAGEGKETQYDDYIRERITMQWGGLSDPFDMFEKKYRVGLDILRTLKKHKYPLCMSTKGTWWLDDPEYLELFTGATYWNTKFSIINYDAELAKKIEVGVPSPEERLKAIEKYASLGAGGATLRLRPFIIGMTDKNDDYLYLIERAAKAGATAVSTEFFCLEGRIHDGLRPRYQQMSDALGFDIVDFYKNNSMVSSGYMRLNWKVKEPYVNKMEALCKKLGLRFYVSDAHHKDKCANGSCCGLGNNWNYQKGQFTEILVQAKKRKDGLVYWSQDMDPHIQMFKKFLWRRADGFNTQGTRQRMSRLNQTMYDYIHEIWNSPNNAKSPYKYFQGLLRPVGLDDAGDVIYKYHKYPEEK